MKQFCNKFISLMTKTCSFGLLILFSNSLYGTESYLKNNGLLFNNYNTQQGLSQVSINDIIEDHHGFIWIATQSGLNRFDGYTFKTYKSNENKHSLTSNFITDLYKDANNNIWIAYQLTGLSIYDPATEKFEHYQNDVRNSSSLSSNFVNIISQDADGEIWVGTNRGIDKWDPKRKQFVRINQNEQYEDFTVQDIEHDSRGSVWIATNKGLYRFDKINGNFSLVPFSSSTLEKNDSPNILSLHIDDQHLLWVGTTKGFFAIETKAGNYKEINLDDISVATTNISLSSLSINDINSDDSSKIWFATEANGFCQLDKGKLIFSCQKANQSNPMALPTNSIQKIFFDRNNQLWIGTSASGLSKHVEVSKNFTTIRDSDGVLNGKIIFSILEQDNKLWVGSLTKGITQFDLNSDKVHYFQINTPKQGILKENGVVGLVKHKDDLWIGYRNVTGLTRLELSSKKSEHYEFFDVTTNEALRVRQILEYDDDTLIFSGPDTGVIKYNSATGAYKTFRIDSSNSQAIPTNNITAMTLAFGDIWLASDIGLIRFSVNTEQFELIKIPTVHNQKSANYLFSIAQGIDNDLWIGSQYGLHHYDLKSNSFNSYFKSDGLPNEEIDSILMTDDGKLWLATNRGLVYFDYKQNKINSYFESDGIQANEHAVGAFYKGESGYFYFGGVNGFTFFNPNSFKQSNRDIFPKFLNLYVANKLVTTNSEQEFYIEKALHELEQITLSYKQANLFSIDYASLDYFAPNKVEYRYKMKGLFDDWVNINDEQRRVTFTGLSPGTYDLILSARYSGDVWPEGTSSTLTIHVLPPVWRTWWAYAIYILIICSIALRYVAKQKRKLLAKEKATIVLEAKVAERTKELVEKNEQVLSLVEQEKESKLEAEKSLKIIKEQHAQLESTMSQLKDTQMELVQKEKMASLGNLVAGIAHEVNTPIGICVTGISHLKHQYNDLIRKIESNTAQDDDLTYFLEDVDECCEIISSNTEKASSIIQSFKRIAVDQSSEDVREFYVLNYLNEIILSMKPVLKKLNHKIEISCAENLKACNVAGAFAQVITNLINNSTIHAFSDTESGLIEIIVSDIGEDYEIIFKDNGKGMNQEQIDNYFEPFYTTKRNEGGSGLGGNLIFNLVTTQLGGKIEIKSELNNGTSVYITIPKIHDLN